MKIKVDRRRLIAAIEKKHRIEQQELAQRKADFPGAVEKFQKGVVAELERAVAYVTSSNSVEKMSSRIRYGGLKFPDAPHLPKDNDLSRHIEAIKRLELSDDDHVVVTERDDYFRYI